MNSRASPSMQIENPRDCASKLELLRLLDRHPQHSQRQIAESLGMSLGKTHYLLKALLEKGWVKIRNFERSGNKLGYVYLLTPLGAGEKIKLARTFLVRKELEYAQLRREIDLLRTESSPTDAARSNVRESARETASVADGHGA